MRTIIVALGLSLLVWSCGSNEGKPKETAVTTLKKEAVAAKPDNSKEGLKKQIKNLEDTLYASETLDKKLGNRAIALYQEYHKYYWKDTICPDYLFKAAEIADNMGFPQKAIQLYHDCYVYYPESWAAPYCLFRIGNIYQFTLNDYIEARVSYNDCKREYPKSAIAKDAETMMNNIERGDKDMIREFEKKNGVKKDK
jgi:TolA-binding protein